MPNDKPRLKQIRMSFEDWFDNEQHFCTVQEWASGEGVDVKILSPENEQTIRLTESEIQALIVCLARIGLPTNTSTTTHIV